MFHGCLIAYGKRAQAQIFQHAQRAEDATALGRLGEASGHDLMAGQAVDGFAAQTYGSAHIGGQTADGLQGGGLARAVGPQNADDFPLVHMQAHLVQHFHRPVPRPQLVHFQKHVISPSLRSGRSSSKNCGLVRG